MRFFLVGATGRTGKLIMEQAIARGHSVTAIVRKPGMVPVHENLQIIIGDPLRTSDLSPVLADHDAVLSCLGQRSRADANLLQEAAAAMLETMSAIGVRRFLVVSQGLLFPSRNPIILLLRQMLARQLADSDAMERLVRVSGADWTIVRPPRLREGDTPRGYRVEAGARPGGAWAMRRADLAAFLLDAAEKGEHMKSIVGVTSA